MPLSAWNPARAAGKGGQQNYLVGPFIFGRCISKQVLFEVLNEQHQGYLLRAYGYNFDAFELAILREELLQKGFVDKGVEVADVSAYRSKGLRTVGITKALATDTQSMPQYKSKPC